MKWGILFGRRQGEKAWNFCHTPKHPYVDEMFMFIFKLDLVKWLPVALDLDDLIGKINKGESTKSRKLKIQRSWFIGYF